MASSGSLANRDRDSRDSSISINVQRPSHYRALATPVFSLILAILLCAYARKLGVLSTFWLASHKDALAAVNSVVSATAVLVAGVLAYYRFFRGRTFATRAELAIDVKLINGPESKLLHVITVSIKNVGTVTIWDPHPVIDLTMRHVDGTKTSATISDWYEAPDKVGESPRLSALDSGETGDFFTLQFFDSNIWAVTYAVTVSCATGDTWIKLRTVENRLTDKKHDRKHPTADDD